ncbi:hypothetical protein FHG87_021988 [Trinorchestia longiramus]|nr:hypothetical protein FHG87_021988 [Trinorchestia longiramus]
MKLSLRISILFISLQYDNLVSSSTENTLLQESVRPVLDLQESVRPVLEIQKSVRPVLDLQESVRPVLEIQKSVRPVLDLQESVRPVLDLQESVRPVLDLQESVRPVLDLQESVRPVLDLQEPVLEIQESVRPVLDLQESVRPVLEIQESVRPVLDLQRSPASQEFARTVYRLDSANKREGKKEKKDLCPKGSRIFVSDGSARILLLLPLKTGLHCDEVQWEEFHALAAAHWAVHAVGGAGAVRPELGLSVVNTCDDLRRARAAVLEEIVDAARGCVRAGASASPTPQVLLSVIVSGNAAVLQSVLTLGRVLNVSVLLVDGAKHEVSASFQRRTGIPGMKAQNLGMKVENLRVRAESPGMKAESPGMKAESPGMKAESPGMKAESPGMKAESPGMKAESLNNKKAFRIQDAKSAKGTMFDRQTQVSWSELTAVATERHTEAGSQNNIHGQKSLKFSKQLSLETKNESLGMMSSAKFPHRKLNTRNIFEKARVNARIRATSTETLKENEDIKERVLSVVHTVTALRIKYLEVITAADMQGKKAASIFQMAAQATRRCVIKTTKLPVSSAMWYSVYGMVSGAMTNGDAKYVILIGRHDVVVNFIGGLENYVHAINAKSAMSVEVNSLVGKFNRKNNRASNKVVHQKQRLRNFNTKNKVDHDALKLLQRTIDNTHKSAVYGDSQYIKVNMSVYSTLLRHKEKTKQGGKVFEKVDVTERKFQIPTNIKHREGSKSPKTDETKLPKFSSSQDKILWNNASQFLGGTEGVENTGRYHRRYKERKSPAENVPTFLENIRVSRQSSPTSTTLKSLTKLIKSEEIATLLVVLKKNHGRIENIYIVLKKEHSIIRECFEFIKSCNISEKIDLDSVPTQAPGTYGGKRKVSQNELYDGSIARYACQRTPHFEQTLLHVMRIAATMDDSLVDFEKGVGGGKNGIAVGKNDATAGQTSVTDGHKSVGRWFGEYENGRETKGEIKKPNESVEPCDGRGQENGEYNSSISLSNHEPREHVANKSLPTQVTSEDGYTSFPSPVSKTNVTLRQKFNSGGFPLDDKFQKYTTFTYPIRKLKHSYTERNTEEVGGNKYSRALQQKTHLIEDGESGIQNVASSSGGNNTKSKTVQFPIIVLPVDGGNYKNIFLAKLNDDVRSDEWLRRITTQDVSSLLTQISPSLSPTSMKLSYGVYLLQNNTPPQKLGFANLNMATVKAARLPPLKCAPHCQCAPGLAGRRRENEFEDSLRTPPEKPHPHPALGVFRWFLQSGPSLPSDVHLPHHRLSHTQVLAVAALGCFGTLFIIGMVSCCLNKLVKPPSRR